MLSWTIAGVAVIFAWAAWTRAGRVSRKLEALNQSYWELRYDFTRLRSQVARLDPAVPDEEDRAPGPAATETVAFVPLSSIRKKD
ncbi:MAG: hypothetical protein DMF84_03855 [Acidobacteria bacterium]|nr:MAG: hypothetical protein DMF84_03855 [Acidobacteriota bacterium]